MAPTEVDEEPLAEVLALAHVDDDHRIVFGGTASAIERGDVERAVERHGDGRERAEAVELEHQGPQLTLGLSRRDHGEV